MADKVAVRRDSRTNKSLTSDIILSLIKTIIARQQLKWHKQYGGHPNKSGPIQIQCLHVKWRNSTKNLKRKFIFKL